MNYKIRFAIFIVLLIWVTGIFIEWFIPLNDNLLLALPFLEKNYSLVCHQQQNKLITLGGYKSLVCSRCAGIYLGVLFFSLLSLFVSFKKLPSLKVTIIIALLMIIDVLATSFGIYPYSKTLAFSTGILLGSIGFLYFYFGLVQLIKEIKSKK